MPVSPPIFTVDERRARLALRHHLAASARLDSVADIARGVVCLHATDPATVYLSSWARMRRPSFAAVDEALYERKELVRMLAMRRTMFVVPREDVGCFHAAASMQIARGERKRTEALVAMLGVDAPEQWLRQAEADTIAALEKRGEATAQELSQDVPALAERVRVNVGKKYEGFIGFSSRVLLQLALEGTVIRGRPRGSWLSSQYRWVLTTQWLGEPHPPVTEAEGRMRVVEKWLARYGPGTEGDLRWWTGWTARDIRAALETIGAVAVELDGESGFVLPDDLEPTPRPEPWVALLPSLDSTTMGWRSRDWYLGVHGARLFDTSGNAGPTIWCDGRVVGGWAVRPSGGVATLLLEDVGSEVAHAVDREAARLSDHLADTSVMPRFATPLQKELRAS